MAHNSRRDARASLFVRGVPFHIRRSQLEQVFSNHGEIRDVYIPLDYYTREPRGFAYIEFEDERDARYALKELDGARLWGQPVHIEWAKSDRKTPKEMRIQTGRRAPPRGGDPYDRRGGGGGPMRREFGYRDDRRDDYRGGGYRGDRGAGSYGGGRRGGGDGDYGHSGGRGFDGAMGGRGRYRDGSYSRSPSRERSRGRRRSRRSRSPSSSSYSSASYSDDEGAKSLGGDGLPVKRSKHKKRDRSYSRSSSYSSRSRSRSYSSGSYSSRSSSVDSPKGKAVNPGTTTMTDLSAASILPNVGTIQPDLGSAADAPGGPPADPATHPEDGSAKKDKKKHKHKHRRHRKHRHSDGSRKHKHKHRHKRRKKDKLSEAEEDGPNETVSHDVSMNGQDAEAASGIPAEAAPAVNAEVAAQ